MSLNHSPKIVTDGLVFAYDMNNTKKSWKGAPTSNLIYTTPLTIGLYAYCTGPVATTVLDPIGNPVTANRYTITANSLVPRAAVATNVTVGATYSFSALIRYNGNSPTPSFYVNATKGNPEASGSNTIINETSSFTPVGGNWYLIKWTFTVSASPTGKALVLWGVTSSASDIGNTFDVYNEHLEQSAYVTPFVNGTRSNTQAILDLTKNNTITANSLTYAADGTFSFNGTTDYISTTLVPNKNEGSISVWFKMSSLRDYNTLFDNLVGANDWELWVYAAGAARFRTTNDNSDIIVDSPALSANTWYNITVCWSNTSSQLYTNGVLSMQDTTMATRTTPATLNIGGGTAGNTTFGGSITAFHGYNRALSAAEVRQNFNALRGRYGV